MRFLIAQGPGYYGVNIKLVDGELEQRLMKVMKQSEDGKEWHLEYVVDEEEVSVVLTEPLDADNHAGFDTGMWTEGKAAIDAIVKRAKEAK